MTDDIPTDTNPADADQTGHHESDHATHGYIQDQKRIVARLSRIEGQVRGIKQMAQNGDYCIDILTQISAANSALRSVALLLLDDHLSHCVKQASAQGDQVADEKLQEASAAIARLVKS
ncbi:transcriptional regulator [Bifidobacterium callimiconis]|uniref:Transcriptional regulator n=1 Tax=Bifidobacterium callimiconis TaxID=2306973 RepID=A0A430FBP2_9BIFI|nr:transcriptional regulator [Bifidobacterium callimiconis]